jgi:crossover junction endodeoxyribonuclease RusA
MTAVLVKFTCAGHPVTQGSKRAFVRNGRPILTEQSGDRLRLWRHIIATTARENATQGPLEGPVQVHLFFRLERPASTPKRKRTWPIKTRSGDVDKLARAALDALTGVAFRDDAQVVRLVVEKDWADGRGPGVEVVVQPVRDEQ